MVAHVFERDVLAGLSHDKGLIGILTRKEALGNRSEKKNGGEEDEQGNDHGRRAMAQHDFKGAIVNGQHAIKEALEGSVSAAMLLMPGRFYKAAAQHGRECQRNEAGDENSYHDGDREFV